MVVVADDWSWPHASAFGDPVVRTPAVDALIAAGVLFRRAFAPSPSCTPARGALLAGQEIWRLGEGANLWSTLDASIPVYPDLLESAGYHVGFEGKGWGPGDDTAGGRTRNPAGTCYADFDAFLAARPEGAPFCYWSGPEEPHRPYAPGSGIAAGLDPAAVRVPGFLPDTPAVRSDLLDYYAAVERFDRGVGWLLARLNATGERDDTLLVVTSDNGMPFPRAKANLYDAGTRVPLIIQWPDAFQGNRVIDDFVTLTDIAPTLLAAAGQALHPEMTGRSLLPALRSGRSGQVQAGWDHVALGRERHNPSRHCEQVGYPMRAVREAGFLYVENLAPQRPPAGVDLALWSTVRRPFPDVDHGPTKRLMMRPGAWPLQFALAFERRPPVELYDLRTDPEQLVNVAADPRFAADRDRLASQLARHRAGTGDPRRRGRPAAFDGYPYRHPAFSPPTLTASPLHLSVSAGGEQVWSLRTGTAHAGRTYIVLGSLTGTAPGIVLGRVTIPLVADAYTAWTAQPTIPLLFQHIGRLDGNGNADAAFIAETGALAPAMAGMTLFHAFAVIEPYLGLPAMASNPCRLMLRR